MGGGQFVQRVGVVYIQSGTDCSVRVDIYNQNVVSVKEYRTMCDDQLLQKLKTQRNKPKTLHCTQNTNCWCNDLSFRFPMNQVQDECMSPKQILMTFESELSIIDQKYLVGLSDLEFVIK